MDRKRYYDRPLVFFFIVMSLSWIPWLAAVASGLNVDSIVMKVLIAAGGMGPIVSALILVYSSNSKALQTVY